MKKLNRPIVLGATVLYWAILAIVGSASAFAASGAEVRMPDDPGSLSQPGGPEERAVPLPQEMTICRNDRACWSERGRTNCRSDAHPAGQVVRVLPVDESSRLPDALQACWQELEKR